MAKKSNDAGPKVSITAAEWCAANRYRTASTVMLLGRRVRLSDYGVKMGLRGRATSRFGTITHVYGLTPDYIGVRRDGIKTPDEWSASFWELPVNAAAKREMRSSTSAPKKEKANA